MNILLPSAGVFVSVIAFFLLLIAGFDGIVLYGFLVGSLGLLGVGGYFLGTRLDASREYADDDYDDDAEYNGFEEFLD